ncbi:hypothetical protein F4779DRAFT_624334 [Xylariaceae sp. FL0662B]|nr:hypothetical protein F4779DRAFT_624334 [Xylariaceae sp. FL0662B]
MFSTTRSNISLSVLSIVTIALVPVVSYWRGPLLCATQLPWVTSRIQEPAYQVQVFNTDPVILYIKDFLSKGEIAHIVKNVEGKYETSRIWTDEIGFVDEKLRASETADIPRDDVVRKIEKRARRFMGWRNNNTGIQPLKAQRYHFNGFYTFHYDWVDYDTPYPDVNNGIP